MQYIMPGTLKRSTKNKQDSFLQMLDITPLQRGEKNIYIYMPDLKIT